jgi:L-fucose mutarotase/ribose pyranase (RbsD/FucU family)
MQVPPEVNPELLSQLKDMGFGHERAVRAVCCSHLCHDVLRRRL